MDNKIDYSVRKGIRPTPKCEDYELCACDADGASHTLKVSFNESDQIVDAVIERVNNNGQLEWRGPEDGLPPVGARCELYTGESVEIISHAENKAGCVAIYKYHNDNGYLQIGFKIASCFRPIRSEEDKAVEEMVSYIYGLPVEDKRKAEHAARVLYRAGYRKQEDK